MICDSYCIRHGHRENCPGAKYRSRKICFEWNGRKTNEGYGIVQVKGKQLLIHRIVYTGCFGAIPEGMQVCHKCDNRLCINPHHLFLGSNEDNRIDMVKKGRAWWQEGLKP